MVSEQCPGVREAEEQEVIRGCSMNCPTLLQELEESFALYSAKAVLRREMIKVDRKGGNRN